MSLPLRLAGKQARSSSSSSSGQIQKCQVPRGHNAAPHLPCCKRHNEVREGL